MAERVRVLMEAMAPELEELRKRGLCSLEEVRQLAKRRERAEYQIHRCAPSHPPRPRSLRTVAVSRPPPSARIACYRRSLTPTHAPRVHRPQPTRDDFLKCLQLEMNLESLLRCRSKRLGLTKQRAKHNGPLVAVRKRVHFIFSRALRRFKGDEQLWLQWIEYAQRTRSHNRLSQIFGRSLALLPHSSRLWIKAAAWELEVRNNAQAARRLLQRALRVNGGEPELWAAYFRFELIFAQKVKTNDSESIGHMPHLDHVPHTHLDHLSHPSFDHWAHTQF